LDEIMVTPDVFEVKYDQPLIVENCHVKLENVDETVDELEEDPLHIDLDVKPEVTAASSSGVAVDSTNAEV
jgi:hypothetical protein